jgi:hypothetical protein
VLARRKETVMTFAIASVYTVSVLIIVLVHVGYSVRWDSQFPPSPKHTNFSPIKKQNVEVLEKGEL